MSNEDLDQITKKIKEDNIELVVLSVIPAESMRQCVDYIQRH
jgi:NADH/NAD ratio-sensing transcriptional regulator Rex